MVGGKYLYSYRFLPPKTVAKKVLMIGKSFTGFLQSLGTD